MWDKHVQIQRVSGSRRYPVLVKINPQSTHVLSASCYIVESLFLWLAEGGLLISVYPTSITFFLFVAENFQAERVAASLMKYPTEFPCCSKSVQDSGAENLVK